MKIIDNKSLAELTAKAKASPRKRTHFNLHPNLEDSIHRLCIAVEPGSYVRPHRHLETEKWELLIILKGKFDVLIFNDEKVVTEKYQLDSNGDIKSIEIDADKWHTFVSKEEGSVVMEVKRGPYSAPSEKDCCEWAPKEGGKGAEQLECWFGKAEVGEKAPLPKPRLINKEEKVYYEYSNS